MAGDWIKVETVTADKPEVHAIATSLGISPEAALGHLFRVWIWADQQSLNGHALRVTDVTLDSVARRDGFATAMRNAGWLVGESGAISFPNFDRHNGKTAKNRALAKDRKVTQRSRANSDNSVTREEKRRSKPNPPLTAGTSTPENPTPPPESPGRKRGRRAEATPFPADFAIDEGLRVWAKAKGYGRLEEHLEAFRAKCLKVGRRYVDWRAAFQEAVREDWAGLRGKNGNHAAGAPASGWKAGGEPAQVLRDAGELLGISPWADDETHGQFRKRIVDAGGEQLLRGRG